MILKDQLYKILSADSDSRSFELELLPDCVIYKAHFPERAITPGVCIIQTASELLGELTGSQYQLAGVANAKYLAVVDPAETPCVTYIFKKISPDEESHTLKVSVEVRHQDTTYTKLSLIYNNR